MQFIKLRNLDVYIYMIMTHFVNLGFPTEVPY